MGCASYFLLCLLVLVSAPASAYNRKEEDVEKVSGGEDNVDGMLTKFRFLLGLMEASRSRRQTPPLPLSPAPAPTEEAVAPSQAPVFYTNIYTRPPLYHKSPYAPALHSKDGSKARHRRIILAIVVSVGVVLLVVCGVAVLAVYKRGRRRRRDRPASGNSKVSYDPDPGPEMFYLNALAPILEIESTRKKSSESNNALSSESLCASASSVCPDEEILCTDSLQAILRPSESVLSSRPLQNGETTITIVSCLGEEVHRTGFLNSTSEEEESFHSVCNCHSPDELLSVVSEANLSCPSGKCSPFSGSSRRSTSSEFKPTQFPPIPSHASDDPKEEQSSELEMTSLLKSSMCASPIPIVSSSPLMPTALAATNSSPQPTKPLSSSATTSTPAAPVPPMPPLRDGNILTPPPPPPPLPPSRASSSQSGRNSARKPPPPPPPCLPQQSAAVGKDGTLLPKLKPLHWDKVRATPDRSMAWDKIRSSSFELDERMIESLFRYKAQSNAETEEAKNKNSSPSKHVLEHKRLQNITILMKALNATSGQVCEALLQGRGLSAQQLEALAKMAPTKEEEEKLANFKGDTRELGSAEVFVKAILDVPFAFSRIQVMLYRETFQDEVVHLKKSFAMLEEACKELRSSRLFFRLLEAVLKTGNRMNVGTIRGGARAFKLDTLLKLADVKGADGKTTLLHFVVQEIIRSEGLDIVSGLSTELCNVRKTASVDLDVLASSVSNLSEGMRRLKRLVEVDISIDDEENGSFVDAARLFSIRAEETIEKLKEDEDRVLVHVREITEYYHGDVGKDEANPLRIFVIVRDFVGMLDRVCKELGSSKTHWCANSSAPFR